MHYITVYFILYEYIWIIIVKNISPKLVIIRDYIRDFPRSSRFLLFYRPSNL